MTTLCRDCDHVHTSTRSQSPFHWRCLKFPVPPDPPYPDLDPDWTPNPPYQLCRYVRGGREYSIGQECEEFSPRRGQTVDGINA